jgi:hypothetical protein
MNDMSGIDLAHQMTAERRGLRVLLKSGKSGLCRKRGVRLFGETYSPDQLRNAVAGVLRSLTAAQD